MSDKDFVWEETTTKKLKFSHDEIPDELFWLLADELVDSQIFVITGRGVRYWHEGMEDPREPPVKKVSEMVQTAIDDLSDPTLADSDKADDQQSLLLVKKDLEMAIRLIEEAEHKW